MFKRTLVILVVLFAFALLAACGPGQDFEPTLSPTNIPTETPIFTPTAAPSETPVPALSEVLLTNEQVNGLIDFWDSDYVDLDQSRIEDPNTGEIILNPLCETDCAARGWNGTGVENSEQQNTLGVNLFHIQSEETAGNYFTSFVLFYDAQDYEIVDHSGIPHELIYPHDLPDIGPSYLGLSPEEDELILIVKHNQVIMEIKFIQPGELSEQSIRSRSDLIYFYGISQVQNLLASGY